MTKNIKKSNTKICASLLAALALFINLALPVNAAQRQDEAAVAKDSGQSIRQEIEAREKAPHDSNNRVMYRVKASHLNERTGPGTRFPRVGTLARGTLLEIREVSQDGKWALAHTGTWLSVKYLEKDKNKPGGQTAGNNADQATGNNTNQATGNNNQATGNNTNNAAGNNANQAPGNNTDNAAGNNTDQAPGNNTNNATNNNTGQAPGNNNNNATGNNTDHAAGNNTNNTTSGQ